MANNLDLRIFDEKEIVPNGRLEDLITAAVRLLESPTIRSYRTICYVFFGITDLLDVKQSEGYREVVLRESGDTLLLSKIEWAVRTIREKKVLPMMCTFPPMSFIKHNQFLLRNGLTGRLIQKSEYHGMQMKLNAMVAKVNTRIEELNCESGVVTCQLSAKLFSQDKGRFALKDIYLKDGLHLTSQGSTLLNVELAQNLRKMKQGKRCPDWLKRSHQVKSSSAISFSIKKKPDEQNTVKDKLSTGKASDTHPHDVTRREKSRSPDRGKYSVRRKRSPGRRRPRSRERHRTPPRRPSPPFKAKTSPQPSVKPVPSHNANIIAPFQDRVPQASHPLYQAIKVPPPAVIPEPKKLKEPKPPRKENKARGSFALSALLGTLSGKPASDSDSSSITSDDGMSISPPRAEADPDIMVIADIPAQVATNSFLNSSDPTVSTKPNVADNFATQPIPDEIDAPGPRQNRSSSTTHSKGRRSRSRDRHRRSRDRRSRSRDRGGRSRSERSESRDRSRRGKNGSSSGGRDYGGYGGRRSRSRSRGRSRGYSPERSRERYRRSRSHDRQGRRRSDERLRGRSTENVDRFGRSKTQPNPKPDDPFQSSQSLLGDRPKSLLGNAPEPGPSLLGHAPEPNTSHLPDDRLIKLAQEHEQMTGKSTRGHLDTLTNLSQLTSGSDSLSRALQLQKEALATKMSTTVEEQKNKVMRMLHTKQNANDPFNQALQSIMQQSQPAQSSFSNPQISYNYQGMGDPGMISQQPYGYGYAQTYNQQQQQQNHGGYGGYPTNRDGYGGYE